MAQRLFGYAEDETLVQDPQAWEPSQAPHEHHATPSRAALAGALTGGLIGVLGGPVGVASGAMGGALVGLLTERLLHGGGGDEPHRRRAWNAEYDQDDIRTRARERVLERKRGAQNDPRSQLRQEELAPRLLPGEHGEIEVRKEVETERRMVEVPVARQGVAVERRRIPRLPANGSAGEEHVLRLPIQQEEVVVEKVATVREVISVAKRQAAPTVPVPPAARKEAPSVRRAQGQGTGKPRATPVSGGSPPA